MLAVSGWSIPPSSMLIHNMVDCIPPGSLCVCMVWLSAVLPAAEATGTKQRLSASALHSTCVNWDLPGVKQAMMGQSAKRIDKDIYKQTAGT